MEPKQLLVLFSVLFACYLVLSLSPVSAYQAGEVFGAAKEKTEKARLVIEPIAKIVDELEPIDCGSSGYVTFRAYVENVPEFSITGSEASLEDASTDTYYNITSSLSCTPKTELISNQEITCRLNIKELLSKIPSCPLENTDNKFYLTLEISYMDKKVKVTDSKSLTITQSGIEPGLEINFAVSQPPYPIPEINCKTGSEIDVPVVIHHAETLFGQVAWSFSVNSTAGSMVECNKITSSENEGRDDIYLCTLTVPNTLFRTCEDGADIWVGIGMKAKGYNLSSNFSTILVAQELDLSLRLSKIKKIECQIISEDGTCVPMEPQQNVTATITGNVPEKLKVFDVRYKIGNSNITLTSCRKLGSSRYECATFITIDKLSMPANKNEKTNKTREITLFLDVKYLNYYKNISAKTSVEMEGSLLQELINTLELLEKDKGFLDWVKNNSNHIENAYRWVNIMTQCCDQGIKEQMEKKKYDKVVLEFAESYLWGPASTGFGKVIGLITQNGPGILGCIAEKGMGDVDKQIQNLQKFERGEITTEIKIPNRSEMFKEYIGICTAQNFWDKIKSSGGLLICLALRIFLDAVAGGLGEDICKFWNNPVLKAIRDIYNALLIVISALLTYETLNEGMKSLALAAEGINLQLKATQVLTDYAEALQNTMESLATSLSVSSALQNLTSPQYDMVKLIFISDRAGGLKKGDDICSGDLITIDYDLEKLSQIEDFVPKLTISPSKRGPLLFDSLKGTYGPYETDILLGTDPNIDPSETYNFMLLYGNKRFDYQLNYVNYKCT